MNCKQALIVLATFLMINSVNGLSTQLSEIKNTALPGEELNYLLRLTNEEPASVNVYINTFVIDSTFGTTAYVKPSYNLVISPDEELVVNITIPVSESMMRGIYLVPLYITHGSTTDRVEIKSTVLEKELVSILTNLQFSLPSDINPREPFTINGSVVSSNEAYPVLTIIASNNQGIVYNHSSLETLTYGTNHFNRTITLNPRMISGDYTMVVQFSFNNRVGAQAGKVITIMPYSSLINKTIIDDSIIGRRLVKSVTNNGTNIEQLTISHDLSFFESILMTNAELIIKQDSLIISSEEPSRTGNRLISELTLNPGDRAELIVETTYLPLTIIPFAVVLAVLGWLFLTKKVIVEKRVTEAYSSEGLIYVKVSIKVRNVSLNKLNSIRVIESLPAYIKGVGVFGSIKGLINKKKREIAWDTELLKPKEEVRITYKFKTGVELIGNVILPPAIVKYRVKRKVHQVKSNTPMFYIKSRTK